MAEYIEREAALNAQNKSMNLAECRKRLERLTAADVVARDCYDRLLAENDALRKGWPVIRCGECTHWERDVQIGTCSINGERHFGGWFCADGERKDGDGE